ncbi:GRAM domain-containing protein YSP2 [Ceratobasidium theobromae]|uniref:GRAM domain-containing protein YSP2 n=1 Tax=Ceratobasidium theobromae TaxID=1582974 RepID=A0A5N5QQL4_9AGAM|nr:GRAM domain-containing protein YSP2 [Ceratobasidium theobromae]
MSTEVISATKSVGTRSSIADPLLSKSSVILPDTRPRQDSVISNDSTKSSSRPGSQAGRSSIDGYESEGGPQAPPIPGFVVASSKRNADFHELFPNVPEMDYLVQDYGCAWHRDILVQGRLYISENHLCFYANIFGWVTTLTIPFLDVVTIEKRMTAYVIPNAIFVKTYGSEYTFASFLTRDTVYDLMRSLWHPYQPSPGQVEAGDDDHANEEKDAADADGTDQGGAQAKRKPTECACGKEGQHYSTVVANYTITGTPEKIHELMFNSAFMNDFFTNNQKLLDLKIGEWLPKEPDSKLQSRDVSFIKPLNATIGPKQTKCEIKDETIHMDFDNYVSMLTTTRTPDVPSGGLFSVKSRACLTWGGPATTKILVTSVVEWTGRSFIRSIIDKAAIDGQMQYHKDLEKAMRAHIAAHRVEFVPSDVAASESELGDTSDPTGVGQQIAQQDETVVQGLGRTKFDLQVIQRVAQDVFTWGKQMSGTHALGILVLVLMLSNIWSLLRPIPEPRTPGDAQSLKSRSRVEKSSKRGEAIDLRLEIRELRRSMEAIERRLEKIEASLDVLD